MLWPASLCISILKSSICFGTIFRPLFCEAHAYQGAARQREESAAHWRSESPTTVAKNLNIDEMQELTPADTARMQRIMPRRTAFIGTRLPKPVAVLKRGRNSKGIASLLGKYPGALAMGLLSLSICWIVSFWRPLSSEQFARQW